MEPFWGIFKEDDPLNMASCSCTTESPCRKYDGWRPFDRQLLISHSWLLLLVLPGDPTEAFGGDKSEREKVVASERIGRFPFLVVAVISLERGVDFNYMGLIKVEVVAPVLIDFCNASACGSANGKVERWRSDAGTQPERNDRRPTAGGSTPIFRCDTMPLVTSALFSGTEPPWSWGTGPTANR